MTAELLQYFLDHYYPRNEVIYRLPVSLPIGEAWPEIMAYRQRYARVLPLRSWDGKSYWYADTAAFLSSADRFTAITRDSTVAAMPQYAIADGLIDEAYYSSVIEGAYTTRQRAHEFISQGTAPKDRGEQMILNNYAALRFVLDHLDGPINEEVILEIARMLTEGTWEDGGRPGYRDTGVQVVSGRQEVVYVAPDAAYIRPMMAELLDFINDPAVHPVIKACAAHLYFVTIHPLFDGNGRTARALSYMILLKAGYSFIRFFPISGLLAEERSRYYKAIRASQDPENGYDVTYFMEYYAGMLARGVDGIHERVRQNAKLMKLRQEIGNEAENARLLSGAKWLVGEDIRTITADKWKNKFKVSFETARKDLMKLEEHGFVSKRLEGRKMFFDLV